MAKTRLTAKGLRALTTERPQADFWDELTPGLHVRVSGKTGRKTWYVRYRANGTHRRMKLGTYPGVTLADARDKARDIMVAADAGEDPARERQARKATDTTFRAMARDKAYAFSGRADGESGHGTNPQNALARIREASKLPRWTAHDFRRTFRTHATRPEQPSNRKGPAGLGVLPHVADAVLGHKEASLGFDRYTGEPRKYLLAEKREALEKWGAFVREAVEAKK